VVFEEMRFGTKQEGREITKNIGLAFFFSDFVHAFYRVQNFFNAWCRRP